MKELSLSPVARFFVPAACAVALLASLAVPAAPAIGPYRVPRPAAKTLDNGLKILVFPDSRLPRVEVQLRVPAGAVAEPPDQNGVANVTARMLGRGTTSRSAESFALDLAQLGTTLSVHAGREYAIVSCVLLSRDFESGLELVGDAVSHPVFLDDEFRRVVSQAGRGVIQSHQNPITTVVEQLWTLALPDAPAARPPLGRLESLGRLTRDQARTFHRERYRPDGAVLAIAGDVTPERAYAVAAEWFGGWLAGDAPPAVAPGTRQRAPRAARIRVVDQPSATGCAIAVGLVVPGRASPDALARSVAASLFERQLAERSARGTFRDARGALELTREFGLLTVHATAPVDSAAVLALRLKAELKQFLAAPPALQEVTAAQHRIRRGFPLAFEPAASLVSQWLLADHAGFPADYFDGYGARVLAFTPRDLHAAARREADPDHLGFVAVGPAKQLVPLLEALGPVEIVTLDPLPQPATTPAETLPKPTAEQEASGRRLITQALAAHGGRERLSGIKSSLVDASIRFLVPGSEVTGTMRQLRMHPDRLAIVTSVRGVDTRQVLNGARSWTVIADSDTALEGDSLDVEALRTAYTSDLPHLLLAGADRNARVAARGRERIGGRETDKVEVVTGADPWRMLYLDATSHRLVAFDQPERGPRGFYMARRVYGDYRMLDGIQWPYLEERFASNQPLLKLDVTGVQLNPELGEDHFRPPRASVAPWR